MGGFILLSDNFFLKKRALQKFNRAFIKGKAGYSSQSTPPKNSNIYYYKAGMCFLLTKKIDCIL